MGKKIFRNLLFGSLAFVANHSAAQGIQASHDIFGKCSPMSKDSKCWMDKESVMQVKPPVCTPKVSCEKIKVVTQTDLGQYNCTFSSGSQFSCDEYIQEFGTHVEGAVVKVTFSNSYDAHLASGHSKLSCLLDHGIAEFDLTCSQIYFQSNDEFSEL